MIATFDLVRAYKCTECEVISAEPAEGPLYECANGCGQKFTRENSHNGKNQCPQCYKMAGRAAELACVECQEAEVEEMRAVVCPDCDALIEQDEFPEHLEQEHVDFVVEQYLLDAVYVEIG